MLERSGFRAGAARPFSNFLEKSSRRITRNDGNGDDATARGFHFFAAHDLIARPIAALYENVREQSRDDLTRREIIENHHGIHGLQRRKDFRALALCDYRTALTFQLPHTSVTIQADDERVAQLAGKLQAANVTRVQQIEATIRENDAAAVAFLAAKPQNRFLKREDRRIQKVSMEKQPKIRTDAGEKSSLSRAGVAGPPGPASAMKHLNAVRAVTCVLLCAAGAWLAVTTPYQEKNYIIGAGGCQLETTIVEKPEGTTKGSVVLFHGISANKKIMSYLAHGFAEEGLRVYVPDLPGHGRTPGPFSPARAEECGESLVRELLARGAITPDRTILAGHSMGGAIAVRIASRVPVAAVIAISPAPMQAAHGVSREKLLFTDPPDLPPHSLVIVGGLELESMRGNAMDLVASNKDESAKYLDIPRASHVSILFSSSAMRASQEWSAKFLRFSPTTTLPSHRAIAGALAGFAGILLLTGPFLREAVGKIGKETAETVSSPIGLPRLFLEIAAGAVLVVLLLRFWIPLKDVAVFQGDYLASFLLLLGIALVAAHWNAGRSALAGSPRPVLAAAFAGLLLLILITAWFDLTFSEAWLTASKWARFPLLLIALLPYHIAEETLLGPVQPGKKARRLALALSLRLIIWGAIMGGVLFLHNGEILMGLLALYMALFNLLQRSAMDIVRKETGSVSAAALFGAILLAGFCLVIFPIT
jgi:alpha-beta hydrolase superfamily lysophospholipase